MAHRRNKSMFNIISIINWIRSKLHRKIKFHKNWEYTMLAYCPNCHRSIMHLMIRKIRYNLILKCKKCGNIRTWGTVS
jgi:translation initiation factor 2 beta subunit (eIF-2beta)/eIF-5